MENTSASELAQEVLQRCLAGGAWQGPAFDQLIAQSLDPETASEASAAFFRILVEGLADRFEPALCDVYAELFAEAVGQVLPEVWPAELVARYRRIREIHPFAGDPTSIEHVFVLSRVTLGADIVVSSTMLAGLKQRFPAAQIYFCGPRKNFELFAADPRLQHVPVEYRRGGTLAARLQVWPDLQARFNGPHSLVIDPDSRYTQLGLLPVCPEERYFFFESRAFGGSSDESLSRLTSRWMEWTFGISGCAPYIAPEPSGPPCGTITMSLGVGENEDKRLPDPFERGLIQLVGRNGRSLCVDSGAGGLEAMRVDAALRAAGVNGQKWSGSFASFADQIRQSSLYVGYDSAGQHAAAAAGVRLITIFAGFVSERMFHRWQPTGPGECTVIRVDARNASNVLERVAECLQQ